MFTKTRDGAAWTGICGARWTGDTDQNEEIFQENDSSDAVSTASADLHAPLEFEGDREPDIGDFLVAK